MGTGELLGHGKTNPVILQTFSLLQRFKQLTGRLKSILINGNMTTFASDGFVAKCH